MAKKEKTETKKRPGLGASYTAFTTAADVAAPATDLALFRETTGAPLVKGFGTDLGKKVWTPGYAANLGVAAIDVLVDKKMRTAQAISRGSVTAVIPELYLGAVGWDAAKAAGGSLANNALVVHRRLIKARQGLNLETNAFVPADPEFRRYRVLKHGLQAARYVANRTSIGQRLARPLKKGLSALGMTG